ncbi:MAG: GNVR domain-containing protein [Hyphomicrobium sp.]
MPRQTEDMDEQEEGGGAMSLERAISAVLKRIKLVFCLTIMAAAVVAASVYVMPDRYDASAIVQIDPRFKSITQLDGVVSELRGDSSTVESEIEIIQSRPIILQVIETLDLRNDPEFLAPSRLTQLLTRIGIYEEYKPGPPRPQRPRESIADILTVDEPGTSRPESDWIADAFMRRLKVTRVRNTLLIDIRFSASESRKAARIANTIAEVYLKEQLASKTRASSTASVLLDKKLDEMRSQVSDAERRVEQWKAEHNVFDSEGEDLSEKQLARLMEQTVAARNETSEAKAKFEQAQKLARAGDSGTALLEVLKSDTVRVLKEQMANATRRAAELRTKYGPKHPDILKVNAEVAEAESQIKAEIERLIENLQNQAEVAVERERQLVQSLNQLKDQQVATKDVSAELKDLEREAASSRQIFEALLVRYKQTSETQGLQLPDVRIIEKADAPQFPASPKRKQLIMMAGFGGLILGLGLAILLELLAPGISRQEDVSRTLETDHLSSVPTPNSDDAVISAAKAVRLVVAEPQSRYADAIRDARRELDMRRTSTAPRIILVTSSVAGEGAEVIASNLAHNYAMTGGRPLLIDGDLRLLPLTRQLAAERSRGLFDQVIDGQPIEAAILRDGLTDLHFLPAMGQAPPRKSIPETLNSDAMAQALAGLKSYFDTIIISAPPLLPVIDGRILADYADQIVFVVAWQKTPKQIAKAALKTLGINNRKLSGAVLNDVAIESLDETRGWQRGFMSSRHTKDMSGSRYAA